MLNDNINEEIEETVEEEVQDIEQPVEEVQSTAESVESINFRKMREDREKDREARIRAEYEAEKMRDYINSLEAQKQQQSSEPDMAEDDYVEYKDFKNVRENQRRQAEQVSSYEKALVRQERQLAKMRLLSEYKDYDSVVTQENLDLLERLHPEVSPAIINAASEYDCGKAAYLFVKKFVKEDQQRAYTNQTAKKNLAKPMPAASVSAQDSNSPLNQVNNYVKDYTNINFNDDYWENLRREKEAAIRSKK